MWPTRSDALGVALGGCSAGPGVPTDNTGSWGALGREGESCSLVSRVGIVTLGACSCSPVAVWGLAMGGPCTFCVYQ